MKINIASGEDAGPFCLGNEVYSHTESETEPSSPSVREGEDHSRRKEFLYKNASSTRAPCEEGRYWCEAISPCGSGCPNQSPGQGGYNGGSKEEQTWLGYC